MDLKVKGTRRYFNEYMFYRAVKAAPNWIAQRSGAAATDVPMQAARAARARLDEILAETSKSMDDAGGADVMRAIDDALSAEVDGYVPMFTASLGKGVGESKAYKGLLRGFSTMIGATAQSGEAQVAEGGARMPVSPYDPRWASRQTVQAAGDALLAVSARDVAGRTHDELHHSPDGPMFNLIRAEGDYAPVGPAMTEAELAAEGPAQRRYFYEYAIYRAIETSPAWSNSRDPQAGVSPLTASQGRAARQAVEDALRGRGMSLDAVDSVPPVELLRAIDDGLQATSPGHVRLFDVAVNSGDVGSSTAWKGLVDGFRTMTGDVYDEAGYRVTPAGGARMPVSPYDPRWSTRETVLNSGVDLLAIKSESVADIGWDQAHLLRNSAISFDLHTADIPEGYSDLRPAGPAYSDGDAAGLAALQGFMSDREYRTAREWVVSGAIVDGRIDHSKFMSSSAMAKSVAILEHLNNSGVDYTVMPDQHRGQIKARLTGTRMDIRLTDSADNENFVGRIYDNGAIIRYSLGSTGPTEQYDASVGETLKLIDFARGVPMERTDGKGFVGVLDPEMDATDKRQREDNRYYNGRGTFKVGGDLSVSIDSVARSAPWEWFADEAAAETFLRESVTSARERMLAQLDVETMIAAQAEHGDEEGFVQEISGHDAIAAIKSDYAAVLAGEEGVELYAPGYSAADYEAAVAAGDVAMADFIGAAMAPGLTPAQRVEIHAARSVDAMIGDFEQGPDGKRFNPAMVATFMNSDGSVWSNGDNIVGALRRTEIDASELRGDQFNNMSIADRLIKFDEATSVDMTEHPDPTIAAFGEVIVDSLSRYGSRPSSVKIDENGVVEWRAQRVYSGRPDVVGHIGQILPRGEHGEIVTKFAGSENHMFVPGYEATVVAQAPGENKTLEERTRLKGYEAVMADALRYQIRNDITFTNRTEVGEPTSINWAVRNLYDTRHPVDFFEMSAEEGLTSEDREAILATEGLRVRYPTWLGEGSGAMAHARAARDEADLRNDNNRNPLTLTGGRNVSVLDTDASAGVFDPIMTGMARNQGVVRYLVPSATIGEDGMITPGDPSDRVPVAEMSAAAQMGYDPHDRQNMTFSNIMQSSAVVSGVRTAMTQMHGWNFEDGIVISSDFASQHQIRDTGGNMRDLKVGDKLSDFHGNKGVVSLIVDRDMGDDEAEAAGLSQEVEFFRANPELEVVMSPFSAISRFNGGTARELMADPGDLHIGGRDVEGAVGDLNLIITHMAVDAKTNIYDAEAMREGKGRKASSQLAWALQAQGCDEIFLDLYGANTGGIAKVREYLVTLGYDLTPDGELRVGHDTVEGDERKVFAIPEIDRHEPTKGAAIGRVNYKAMSAAFGDAISASGGLMELPFPLKMASGEMTPEAVGADGRTVYHLPVMSSYLRSEQDLGDGTVSRHDHTRQYMSVFRAMVDYEAAVEAGMGPEALAAKLEESRTAAQNAYDSMAGDIVARRIDNKRNMFKESVMGHRVPNSATAVWSGDPRLNVDEIAMNSKMAKELGANVNGYVMVWRDPVLRGGGVRYMKAVIDDSLAGVAVNPVSVKSFDGDFDGDSVGLVGNLSPQAHAEAMATLSVEANLLDRGCGKMVDGEMVYPLALHDSLDTKVAAFADPAFGARMESLVAEINALESDFSAGNIGAEDVADGRRELMGELNSFYKDAFASDKSLVTLQFGSIDDHMKSVARCYETGAKGSPGKLADYAVYLGANKDDSGTWRDAGRPEFDSLKERYAGSQLATALKDQFTGIAGTRSQSVVQLLRAQGLMEAACETGYPASQSMLQAKHDPVDAAYRADILNGPVKDLWSGRKLDKEIVDGRYQWSRVVDDDGKPVQATTAQWVDQFQEMYVSDTGMGVAVGVDQIETVARALSDEHGRMRDTSRDMWETWPEEIRPEPLDQLAYRGKLDDLDRLAREGANLFSGQNAKFAPRPVRHNQRLVEDMMAGRAPVDAPMHSIGAKDVKAGFEPKVTRAPKVEGPAAAAAPTMGRADLSGQAESRPKAEPKTERVLSAEEAAAKLSAMQSGYDQTKDPRGSAARRIVEEMKAAKRESDGGNPAVRSADDGMEMG